MKKFETWYYLLSLSLFFAMVNYKWLTKSSIPYSLALRLRRICPSHDSYIQRTNEHINDLTNRGYDKAFLETQCKSSVPKTGADPGFFLGGGALVSCSTSTPINHFFPAEYRGGVRTPCTLPLDPPL